MYVFITYFRLCPADNKPVRFFKSYIEVTSHLFVAYKILHCLKGEKLLYVSINVNAGHTGFLLTHVFFLF